MSTQAQMLEKSFKSFTGDLVGQVADLKTLVTLLGTPPVAFTDVQDSIVGLEAQVSAIRDLIAHENEQVVALESLALAAEAQLKLAADLEAKSEEAGIELPAPQATNATLPPRPSSSHAKAKAPAPALQRSRSTPVPASSGRKSPARPTARTRVQRGPRAGAGGAAPRRAPPSPRAPSPKGGPGGGDGDANGAQPVTRGGRPLPQIMPMTAEELSSVPKYQRGRLTFDKLKVAVEEINEIIAHKYRLLAKPMSKLWGPELAQYQQFKAQATKEVKGSPFFCAADVKGLKSLKGSTGTSVLQVLRHVKRLKVVSGGGHTRYLLA